MFCHNKKRSFEPFMCLGLCLLLASQGRCLVFSVSVSVSWSVKEDAWYVSVSMSVGLSRKTLDIFINLWLSACRGKYSVFPSLYLPVSLKRKVLIE